MNTINPQPPSELLSSSYYPKTETQKPNEVDYCSSAPETKYLAQESDQIQKL